MFLLLQLPLEGNRTWSRRWTTPLLTTRSVRVARALLTRMPSTSHVMLTKLPSSVRAWCQDDTPAEHQVSLMMWY